MTTTKKMLVAFVLTLFFVISSVHCSDGTSGYGIAEVEKKCFTPAPCTRGLFYCQTFCSSLSAILIGVCESGICCCILDR
ncbi:unnamed protein product [Arabidopsis thaliana]|uniref:Uncharacterized protein n=1 Tax=Arabidopsis thaliana TaxID=3702 RepID=A0A654EJ80_ARATH|nr:unnamed protein product [Arabidopsis thaliana]VYS49387.1 unnamed protein product [Arabidopsis thaliana]